MACSGLGRGQGTAQTQRSWPCRSWHREELGILETGLTPGPQAGRTEPMNTRPHLVNSDGVSLKTGSEREEHTQEATLTSSAPWNVPLSDQGAELWETPEAVACPGTCPAGDRSPRSRSPSTLCTPGDRKPHPSPRPSRALGHAWPTLLRGQWWMLALCAEAQGGHDLARPFLGKQEGGSLGPGRDPTCPHRAGNRKRLRRG